MSNEPSNTSLLAGGERYYTADRRIGVLFGAMSLTATQVSAGTLIGTIGIHYVVGVSFVLIWLAIWAGWLVSMAFIAPQLRGDGGFTISAFLARRFGTGDGHVRGVAAVFTATIYLIYTTAQYVAGGIILQTVFGIDQLLGIALVASAALSYTVLGGMLFSVYSDVVQVCLLLAGVAVAAWVGVADVGGLGQLTASVRAADPALLSPTSSPGLIAGLGLSFGFGIAVAPFEMSRVYAMRGPETVRRSIPVSILLQSVIAACVALLGLVARVQFPALANPDRAVTTLALELFGPVVGGLLLLAVVAGILSTVDSVLLVSAAAISHDLVKNALPAAGVLASAPDEGRLGRIDRLATALAAVVPAVLTLLSGFLGGLVQLIVALYASFLAATLFVPVVAGLHWSRPGKASALAGMIAGAGTVLLWQAVRTSGVAGSGLSAVDPVVPGLLCSFVAVAGTTLLGR